MSAKQREQIIEQYKLQRLGIYAEASGGPDIGLLGQIGREGSADTGASGSGSPPDVLGGSASSSGAGGFKSRSALPAVWWRKRAHLCVWYPDEASKKVYEGYKPDRSGANAGYDFLVPKSIVIPPRSTFKVGRGGHCQMVEDNKVVP